MLTMLESLLTNQQLVERCLTRLRLFAKMFSDDEWNTIRDCQFGPVLENISEATEVLSGSKYPTISLILLFRAEIVAALAVVLPTDCNMVKAM